MTLWCLTVLLLSGVECMQHELSREVCCWEDYTWHDPYSVGLCWGRVVPSAYPPVSVLRRPSSSLECCLLHCGRSLWYPGHSRPSKVLLWRGMKSSLPVREERFSLGLGWGWQDCRLHIWWFSLLRITAILLCPQLSAFHALKEDLVRGWAGCS